MKKNEKKNKKVVSLQKNNNLKVVPDTDKGYDMKKTITFLAAAMMLLSVTSCCKNEPTLSASKAKSLAKKEIMRLNVDKGYAEVPIGYFECNDNDVRYALRQLAACEMITYSCERVKKAERVKKSRRVQRGYYFTYYDTEYYWVNDTVITYFVTTALTEKGEKLLADLDFEVAPTADEKDLRPGFEPDLASFPESTVNYEEFPSAPVEAEEMVEEETAVDLAPSATPDNDTRDAYQRAKDKENYTSMPVKAFELKIIKARNIVVTKIPSPMAEAELVMEYSNVTPFGRVLKHVYDGQRRLEKGISYVYYQDKKWVLKDID